ncbi:MAG: hypothetical protein F4X20_07445 [Dehalococcoidia bacterium]|nr:hypothetical protein [Dehalococcoidia bacterium]
MTTVSRYSADEERVMLALAWADHSMTLSELSASLETSAEDLREAMRSLYRRHFLLISRGIRQIEDTYLLSRPARDYVSRHLLPKTPSKLPIEELRIANRRR